MKGANKIRKAAAFLLAAVLMMAMSFTAMAAEEGSGQTAPSAKTGTITITTPENTLATSSNAYKIYKVFDATGDGKATASDAKISYRLVDGKTEAPDGFEVDSAGNVSYKGESKQLTEDDIKAIADYVKDDEPVDIIEVTGSGQGVSKELPNGYYYITTSTGTVVTIDSTNPNAKVKDKNTVPEIDKKITGASSVDKDGKKALAQIGTNVDFEVSVTIGKGAENYVLHDTMSESLSYNKDAAVEYDGSTVEAANYEIGEEGDDTLTIKFKNEYIQTLEAGKKLVITYSAKVMSDALTQVPAKNTAYVSYGDKNKVNNTPVKENEVYNAKFTITKHDGDNKPLAGAGFVIKNADGKYYQFNAAQAAAPAQGTEGEEGYVPAKAASDAYVAWVDDIKDATEYISDADGAVPAFTGLVNGTYTVIENTVPDGYNKAADEDFTIEEHDYTTSNLEKELTVINKAGVVLPNTGGVGTTLFYIVGAILVIGAGVMLISRRRMEII
ncbi:MAG: isopeptide-forming domain-containing fimbrial protein [Stomatobaculum sp.]|nr:isopeptide-forming domain-containing fimbrial protein [Stomatobaculum sp.]